MDAYRKDQGRMVRMAAFWSVAFMLLFGCTTLHTFLTTRFESLERTLAPDLVIPVLGVRVNGAFLIAGVLCVAGWVLLYRYLQRPKVADLLIDTESELRKVTWPKLQDVTNSSLVVVFCVLFLMGFLAAADFLLGKVFRYFFLGS